MAPAAAGKETTAAMLRHGSKLVSYAYFFSAWGDRMWEFSGVLFVLELFSDTLLPSSLFGFIEVLVGILTSSRIGNYIDTHDRLKVMRESVVFQNIGVCLASLVFYFVLNGEDLSLTQKWFYFSVVIPFSLLAKMSSTMNKICIHKDWLVVLAGGDSEEQTRLNTSMRRIDLITKIASPILVGFISSFFSPRTAALFILIWSAISGVFEYNLNTYVFRNCKVLHNKLEKAKEKGEEGGRDAGGKKKAETFNLAQAFRAYAAHPVFMASFSYSMLYISLLSFGGIMISFLKLVGIPEIWLAIGRGFGAAVGVGASLVAPVLIKGMGLEAAGVFSIWLLALCLAPSAIALLLMDYRSIEFAVSIFLSLGLSRFGLWAFDIVETQIMQVGVSEKERGAINGTQEAFMNIGYLCGFVLTMIFSSAHQFAIPGSISFLSVFLAAVLYTVYYFKGGQAAVKRGGDGETVNNAAKTAI